MSDLALAHSPLTTTEPRRTGRHGRRVLWFAVLVSLLAVVLVAAMTWGSVAYPPLVVLQILVDAVLGTANSSSTYAPWQATVLLWVRLPRVLLCALVGAGLALAGAVLQGVFRNPLADPGVIGVSAGASLGAVLVLYAGTAAWTAFVVPAAAIAGALGTAFLVYTLSSTRGRSATSTLLLAGIAVNSMAVALTSFILSLSLSRWDVARQIVTWMMGDFEARSWAHVGIAAPLVIGGCVWLSIYARDLNVLATGEENALAVGVDVPSLRRRLLILSSIVTAGTVAVVGTVSFVGLVVPHIMRLLLGPDHRLVLSSSLLGGAVFVVLADMLCRTGPVQDLRVGVVAALCGGPFFLYLLVRRRPES